MEYTKGEWTVESFDRDELGAWRLRADGQSIMRLSGFQTPIENKANAHLIASAPDLYEACNTFQTALKIWQLDPSKAPKTLVTIFKETIGKALAKVEK